MAALIKHTRNIVKTPSIRGTVARLSSSKRRACASSQTPLITSFLDLPGVLPLPGERALFSTDRQIASGLEECDTSQVWHKLPPDVQASLLTPRPDDSVGFKAWLGSEHSEMLGPSEYKGTAAIYKLFTDMEAEALITVTGNQEGEHIPSKEDTAKSYVGRLNTLRQAVKDRWLSGAVWQRLSQHPGGLVELEYWNKVVGANSSLRLVRTQPARAAGEQAGRHMKHVDTREDNADYVDAKSPDLHTRISIITVQCYLNPEEHEGGEFEVYPARLNLADPSNKKETILYEVEPESTPDLVRLRIRLKKGEAVVFLQDTDQTYHGGAPVTGTRDKIAGRLVLDMLKKDVKVDHLASFYREPEYGQGFTNDRQSIRKVRDGKGAERNTINCVQRVRKA